MMTEDEQAFRDFERRLGELEANRESAETVRSAVSGLRAAGVTITFDAVMSHLGPSWRGAAIFAALIVRESNRQEIADALAAVPAETAH